MRLFVSTCILFSTLFFLFSCGKEKNEVDDNDNNGTNDPQNGMPFEDVPEVENIIMYEVNLRAFSTTGDLTGVINRLDEIKALGVNVIWLMPIHPIGQINSVNSPYSVKDYKAVSPEYGTLDDLKTLTDEAHAKGMAVIMDWVANHTAWDNPWINNEDWYTQDASGNIIHPPGTNWLDVADLNYDNPDMRKAMIEAMKYWLIEANVDGYRCDYADGVPFDFWQQAIDTLMSIPGRDFVLLAEGSRNDHFTAGFDLTYAWDFYYKMKGVYNGQSANSLFTTHTTEYNNIPGGKHKLRYTTNHDESAWENTPMVFFNGKDGALAASVITIFMGGVPLFYTGQEVGRVSKVPFFSNSPINWDDNPDMLNAYKEMMDVYLDLDVARQGTNTSYPDTDVVCFRKVLDNTELLIVVNIRNSSINFSLPSVFQNTNWVNSLTNNNISLGNSLQLNNYQYLILKNIK
ncbi:MAG: alpha-amylase [Bacteroidales bacterium]|nr:alpha-amylase [Bacteroidales bacterium]